MIDNFASVAHLDSFESELHGWRSNVKISHKGGLHVSNRVGHERMIYIEKEFEIPHDTKWQKLYFEYMTNAKTSLLIHSEGKEVYQGVVDPVYRIRDTNWFITRHDVSKIAHRISDTITVRIMMVGVADFGFRMRNFHILRTPIKGERLSHLPDGHELKDGFHA